MKKTDIHLHLTKNQLPAGSPVRISSAEHMLPYLERSGIGTGVLMSDGEEPAGFCSNEACRDICEMFPGRYYFMCNLDEKSQGTIEERLARYKSWGAVGVGELMINRPINHPFIQEIFRAAEKLELPVLIHMSPKEGFRYGVVDRPGLPWLEETLKRYSGLKLIGHSQPFWHEISGDAKADKESRYRWGEGPVTAGGRLAELFEKYANLYGDLSANSGGSAIMRDEEFGLTFLERFQNRLMFGTDMTNVEMEFPLGAWLDRMYEEKWLSEEAYEAICSGNSKRVLGV